MEEQFERQDVTAEQIEENLSEEAHEQAEAEEQQQSEDASERIREGIAELYADGWSTEELLAFSQDAQAREAIARDQSVTRAACGYLHGMIRQGGKRGVPTVQRANMSYTDEASRIENMTDEQFDAFSRRAHEAMMQGKKVRL